MFEVVCGGRLLSVVHMRDWILLYLEENQRSHYLHKQDVEELASGREKINITLVQLWMIYMFGVADNMGLNDVYGFIDPHMTHEENKFDDIQAYITNCFAMGKELYFISYILGSLTTHMMMSGRSTAKAKMLAWLTLKCNRQSGSYECGYYIMYWMRTTIRAHVTNG
ncbi:hypothetical protein LR48_Vigan02g113600 [Vigna angularis]|uniref:Ubiquitin-like protease family profile domain-containing protein n=1 Tax=Phaseolus angularis TaxID=3914 RepID=A0A0L9TWX1_PHAAN|nr:hypothetical protein LR48_Vigan02g113600 [Vigna angularis]